MVAALARIRLESRDPATLARFYIQALGFTPDAGSHAGSDAEVRLVIGTSRLDLARAAAEGRDYPGDVPGWSLLFQHCAIATGDMAASMARLKGANGWKAISRDGPQVLPPSSGGVTAFKFRDPEGHPLELIAFPGDPADPPRIDHSAISVAETAASVAFYGRLGLEAAPPSFNHGPAQDRLDGLDAARVEVTPLRIPGAPGPHVELLCYRHDRREGEVPAAPGDVAATRLIFAGRAASPPARDPDGHLFEIDAKAGAKARAVR